VPRPNLWDSQAEDEGELVERLGEHGSNGGSSRSLRTIGRSSHTPTCRRSGVATRPRGHHMAVAGFQRHEGRRTRWPITSAEIDPTSFPLLSSVVPRRSVHTAALAWTTRASSSADCRPDAAGGDRRGDRPDDGAAPCASPTRTTARRRRRVQHRQLAHRRRCDGEQIEQSADVRDGHWAEVADAVAAVYARHVGSCHAGVVPLSVSTRTRSSISSSRNQDRTGSTRTAGSPRFRPSCGPGAPATVLRRVDGR
jgi:hypothetical protein